LVATINSNCPPKRNLFAGVILLKGIALFGRLATDRASWEILPDYGPPGSWTGESKLTSYREKCAWRLAAGNDADGAERSAG
jgi:hypothetical protein